MLLLPIKIYKISIIQIVILLYYFSGWPAMLSNIRTPRSAQRQPPRLLCLRTGKGTRPADQQHKGRTAERQSQRQRNGETRTANGLEPARLHSAMDSPTSTREPPATPRLPSYCLPSSTASRKQSEKRGKGREEEGATPKHSAAPP